MMAFQLSCRIAIRFCLKWEGAHCTSINPAPLVPTNCIQRFNGTGNERVPAATQDGRNHGNEYLHNITNESEKRQENYRSCSSLFPYFSSSVLLFSPGEGSIKLEMSVFFILGEGAIHSTCIFKTRWGQHDFCTSYEIKMPKCSPLNCVSKPWGPFWISSRIDRGLINKSAHFELLKSFSTHVTLLSYFR